MCVFHSLTVALALTFAFKLALTVFHCLSLSFAVSRSEKLSRFLSLFICDIMRRCAKRLRFADKPNKK